MFFVYAVSNKIMNVNIKRLLNLLLQKSKNIVKIY